MPEKPKILQVVADMRADGFSDDKIVDNLRQLGLSDDQIKQIMKVAEQDVYSKFKREMGSFVTEKLKKSDEVIDTMVIKSVQKRIGKITQDLKGDTERVVGEFAKTVNQKTDDMTLAVKKVREENLKLMEEEKLNRADIDLLLAGPSKIRLAISILFLLVAIIVVGYAIFFVTPQVVALDFTEPLDGVILLVTGAMYVLAAIVFATVGIYFSGKPGRQ